MSAVPLPFLDPDAYFTDLCLLFLLLQQEDDCIKQKSQSFVVLYYQQMHSGPVKTTAQLITEMMPVTEYHDNKHAIAKILFMCQVDNYRHAPVASILCSGDKIVATIKLTVSPLAVKTLLKMKWGSLTSSIPAVSQDYQNSLFQP